MNEIASFLAMTIGLMNSVSKDDAVKILKNKIALPRISYQFVMRDANETASPAAVI